MTKTEELSSILDEIRDNLINLQYLKKDVEYITSTNKSYFKDVIEKSSFFNRVYVNFLKQFLIDFYKLLNPKEYHSISYTIKFIRSNYSLIEWKREFSTNRIEELDLLIEEFEIDYINNLKNIRDKHLAHSDKNKKKYESTISIQKTWKNLEVIQKIFIELYLALNDKQYVFELIGKTPNEVLSLQKYYEIRNLIFHKHRFSNLSDDLKEVQKIIRKKTP